MTQDPQWREGTGEAGGGRPGTDVSVLVEDASLMIGDVDLMSVRSLLVELGARGSASLEGLSVEETTALLSGIVGIEGALEAVRARALVHLEAAVKEDCLRREETPRQAAHIARSETSRVLKESRSVAGRSLATCRRLVQSMPGMLVALAEGTLHSRSVHRVGAAVAPVPPEMRALVDEVLTSQLDDLKDCGTGEIGDHVGRVLHSLDPEGAAQRHQRAKQDRHVTVSRADHGMATVRALIPAIDAARIRKGLSVAAESARAAGDRRGHQQIMADLFADALIGRGDGIDPSTLEIGVLITDRSLLAPAHADAATIEGYGSVPFEHIRDAMRHALDTAGEDPELALTLRRLFLDAEDGQLVAVESRSRRFPPGLARLLRYAHQSCRAPYCDAGIRQLDHIVPWSRGGKTSRDNGNGACVADNQKEAAGRTARVITDEQGTRRTVEWTTRYGQKARRGGINYDPLGTAPRQRHRRPPDASPEECTPRATSRTDAPPGPTPRDGAEHAERIGVSLQRAVDRIDPALLVRNRHPAGPRSRDRRCRRPPHPRVDYHARRHLIVLDGDPPPTPGAPASPRT